MATKVRITKKQFLGLLKQVNACSRARRKVATFKTARKAWDGYKDGSDLRWLINTLHRRNPSSDFEKRWREWDQYCNGPASTKYLKERERLGLCSPPPNTIKGWREYDRARHAASRFWIKLCADAVRKFFTFDDIVKQLRLSTA